MFYNTSYAVTLFEKYDNNKKINKTKRKPNIVKFTEQVRKKHLESLKAYWSNEDNVIKHSIDRATLTVNEITNLKRTLSEDVFKSYKDISSELGIEFNIVAHTAQMACYTNIAKEYNHIIKNRAKIAEIKQKRKIIRMYREGGSFEEISNVIGVHIRTAIRRIQKLKDEHDERCRMNVITRRNNKQVSLVKTLYNMGYTDIEMANKFNTSRSTIYSLRKGKRKMNINSIGDTRGRIQALNYKKIGE